MIVIPAIDLRAGKCVRLLRGEYDKETIYSDDPLAMASKWKDEGASLIHIVDLDGAKDGVPAHLDIIEKIISNTGMSVEVGGGIRDLETIDKYINSGVKRVILGTAIIKNPELAEQATKKYPNSVYAGIDAKNGVVAIKGWIEKTEVKASELIKKLDTAGVAGLIYTDIMKDGTLEGIDTEHLTSMIALSNLPFVISGGVSTLDDIRKIKKMNNPKVEGVIVGKALYANAFQLKDAINILE